MEEINLRKKYPGVADSPKYQVNLHPKLSVYGSGDINWPQCCVLCLKPIMPGIDFHEISGTRYIDPGTMRTIKVKVPYCSECYHKLKRIFHREKEGIEVVPSGFEAQGIGFRFRNPEYAKLFKQANIKITRWK